MEFKVVIGSWGAYNEADNDLALGSEWIDFAKYNSWDEIEEELIKEGFDLKGRDEELFIQDIDFDCGDMNGDYTHPKNLFEILHNSGVMESEYRYHEMLSYIEVEDWDEFASLVKENGEDWDSDIIYQDGVDGEDFARNEIKEWVPQDIFKSLDSYIDYEKWFEESDAHETEYGVIQLL